MARTNRRQSMPWIGPTVVVLAAALLAVVLFSRPDTGPRVVETTRTLTPPPSAAPAVPPRAPEVPPWEPAEGPPPADEPVPTPGPRARPLTTKTVATEREPRDLSCDDVLNMVDVGVPTVIVLETVRASGGLVPPDGCLIDAGVDDDALLDGLDALRE